MQVIAVDAGGTNLRGALVDEEGRVLGIRRVPVTTPTGPDQYLEQVAILVAQLRCDEPLEALCLAMPGPLDHRSGVVHRAPNLGDWKDVPVRALLEGRLGLRVHLQNDAEAAALGEAWRGAGAGCRCLVAYTLGTGVGGGIVIDGRPWRGTSGSAAELGHVCVDPAGPGCGCGARGCLEAFAGTAGILRLARRRLGNRLAGFQACHGPLEPANLAAAGGAGDPDARAVYAEVGRYLGLAMAGVVATLAPDVIVVCGGVAGAWHLIAPTLLATLQDHSFEAARARLLVAPGSLAEEAALVGATRSFLLEIEPR